MKIGLLTLTPAHNYGGILQAIALYSYLESQGHQVMLIDKRYFIPWWKRAVLKLLEILPFQNIKNKKSEIRKTKLLRPFIESNILLRSPPVFTQQDLHELIESERFDAVVVGSDQVWRYQYIRKGCYPVYFLDFDASFPVKKISYAASYGTDEWEAPEEIDKVSALLKRFHAISTREESGVDICRNTFGVEGAVSALDPTMLVGADFYLRFFRGVSQKKSVKTLVTYILDQSKDKDRLVEAQISSLGGHGEPYRRIDLVPTQRKSSFYSVEEWLWEIKNADFVVTDSFHGMVFSILFERQFFVIKNEARGASRFDNILGKLGLLERLVSAETELLPATPIQYEEVFLALESLRKSSVVFLLGAIGEA